MPEVSRFYGISIKSSPAIFHVGRRAWSQSGQSLHPAELWKVWRQASNLEPLDRIDPLP